MKEHDKNIFERLLSFFANNEINNITIMSLFGGVGVYSNATMFAWIYDNQLYLKGHADYIAMFTRYQMKPLEFNTGVTIKLLQYYQITDYLWQDEKKLIKIIQMVIKYSSQNQRYKLKEERIKDLPNMTISLERALFKVGITNITLLRQEGALQSYLKLKQFNKNISSNVLFILHSALVGKHVATLTDEQKSQLKKECNKLISQISR